jgi:hypothetical protein
MKSHCIRAIRGIRGQPFVEFVVNRFFAVATHELWIEAGRRLRQKNWAQKNDGRTKERIGRSESAVFGSLFNSYSDFDFRI